MIKGKLLLSHPQKNVALHLITLIYYICYFNLGEYHKADNQRTTACDLSVLHSAQPLQNEEQQSRIWDLKEKMPSFISMHQLLIFGSHSKCISDSFYFLAGWLVTVSLPPPHLSVLTLISCTVFCPSLGSDVLIKQACRMLISAAGFKVSLTHFSGNLAQAPISSQHMWQRRSGSPLISETPAVNQRKALSPGVEREEHNSLVEAGAGTPIPRCACTLPYKFIGGSGSVEGK